MQPSQLPNGNVQLFYFLDDHPLMPGWFKGMKQVIQERGLWPAEGLIAQCHNFHCPPGQTDCCCQRLLFSQPDFVHHKSQLEELIESCSHLCDFYPKYHCELKFIEQYWDAAKLRFRSMGCAATIADMEKVVKACLDDILILQIRRYVVLHSFSRHSPSSYFSRYANQLAHFISTYGQGLSSVQAIWANQRYHRHCTLPPELVA